MKKRDIRFASIPSTEEVAAERERLAYQSRYQRVLRSTIYILVVVEQPTPHPLHDILGDLINFQFHSVLAEDIGSNEDFLLPQRIAFVFFVEHHNLLPLILYV